MESIRNPFKGYNNSCENVITFKSVDRSESGQTQPLWRFYNLGMLILLLGGRLLGDAVCVAEWNEYQ
jgi:hypothetical protein